MVKKSKVAKPKGEVQRRKKKKGGVREYAEALITALLVAFVIRSFVIEAFKIPSGSMIPTLVVGDHIFVNKFVYGLRIPFTKTKIVSFGTPQRGESIVFMYPNDESTDYIKRVVGLPGDRVRISGDDLFVNGVAVERQPIQVGPEEGLADGILEIIPKAVADQAGVHHIPTHPGWEAFAYYFEKLGEVNHLVQFDRNVSQDSQEREVPEGKLFVMGDNRDVSSDSRVWGFVPLENVKGKAMFVWLSLDYDEMAESFNGNWIQWNRLAGFFPWPSFHWGEISEGLGNIPQWVRWNRFGKWIR